jgi:hypothetical protein
MCVCARLCVCASARLKSLTLLRSLHVRTTFAVLAPRPLQLPLQSEIKEFLDGEVPLLLLMCTPGLRERHWKGIQGITSTTLPYNPGVTMRELLEEGMQVCWCLSVLVGACTAVVIDG